MMEKPFDTMDVPSVFYTPISESNSHRDAFGQVFAESGDHFEKDWITVGFVSKQSPFGQGTYLGFAREELREATKEEVRAALAANHPHGRKFRPGCMTASNADFHLVMSKVFANWTKEEDRDKGRGTPPIHDISRNQIKDARDNALKEHVRIMRIWGLICWKQSRAIKKAVV